MTRPGNADDDGADDGAVGRALTELTELAVRSLGACDAVVVSLVGDDGRLTAAATAGRFGDDVARSPDGPAVDAARTGLVQHADAVGDDRRWPGLSAVARTHGLVGGFTVPVCVEGVAVAVLGLYSRQRGAFDAANRSRAEVFGELAALVLASARLAAAGRRLSDELYARLADGDDVVDQARGVLMARGGVDAAAAGDALAAGARRHGRTLVQEAVVVAASAYSGAA